MIVGPVALPGPVRDIACFHEAPIHLFSAGELQVVPHGRRHVQAGAGALGIFRAGSPEDITGIIGDEGTAVAPLGVAGSWTVADRYPAILANGFPRGAIGIAEPGNDLR